MRKFNLLLLTVSLFVVLASCDNDDDVLAPRQVQKAFSDLYPHAKRVSWEQKGEYYVAEFRNDGTESDAWFMSNGDWVMTEFDIEHKSVPVVVREALEASEYSNWRVDDVDLFETRKGSYYLFDLEKNDREIKVKFDAIGNLLN